MGRIQSDLKALAPAQHAELITKSDTGTLPHPPSLVYVGGTGNVNVLTARGDTILFSGVPAGTVLPVQVRQVLSTNTTATLMVALY